MKRLFLMTPLTVVVLLLCGCPDAKLPTPSPKVPEPKAETTTLYSPPGSPSINRNFDGIQTTIIHGKAGSLMHRWIAAVA